MVGWGWLSQTRPTPRSPDGDKKSTQTSAPYDIYEFKNIDIEKLPNI